MHIRCPHCRQRVEVLEDDPLVEVECPSCGSSFSLVGGSGQTTAVWNSRKIAHFELLDELGRGAFGTVWKAHDEELDRYVAVKLPREEQLTDGEAEQFLREARAAAQLRHSNLVNVHEVGRDESGQLYIVSDFIQGASLAEYLQAKSLSIREAVALMITLCEAVEHAHDHGVIHRDLKPQNILMDGDGVPHITDFGLAKREAGEITMTLDGKILGTPAYMSPEQAAGKSHQVDRRSDLYSLGVILFELLTGELPFRGSPQMLVLQILNDEPPSPRKLSNRIPRDLETICLKCLEKEPQRRFQSAQDLKDDLQRFVNGESISSRPVSSIERAWRWWNTHSCELSAGYLFYLGIMYLTVSVVWVVFSYDMILRASEEPLRFLAVVVGFVMLVWGVSAVLWRSAIGILSRRAVSMWITQMFYLLGVASPCYALLTSTVRNESEDEQIGQVLMMMTFLFGLLFNSIAIIGRRKAASV